MALKGNLETFLLTSILQLLHNDGKTGALQVSRGSDEVRIIIKEGAIVYAMSTNKEARLGNLLRAKGVIDLEQLEACLAEGRQKKQALGKVLVDKGYITIEALKGFIRSQVEEIIYNLFFWDSGEFVYKDARLDLSGLVVTRLDITNVMLEASRRIDEMAVLQKHIPNDRLIFKLTAKKEEGQEMELAANERKILVLVNGKLTVKELIDESELDRFKVYKVLHSLLSFGLIENRDSLTRHQEGERGGTEKKDDYTPIISGYHNILQILWRNIEPEIGKETSVIFEDCKPEALPGQKGLFKNFHPNNLLPANIYAVKENLKILKSLKNERVFLVESFNRYVLNILNRVPDVLGVLPTQKMLREIEKVLPYIGRYMEELNIEGKNNFVDDLERIMAKVDREISAKDKSKGKSAGIMSMFKKKS